MVKKCTLLQTSILDVKALLTLAVILTTCPTLQKQSKIFLSKYMPFDRQSISIYSHCCHCVKLGVTLLWFQSECRPPMLWYWNNQRAAQLQTRAQILRIYKVFKQVHLSSNTREVPAIISFWRDQKTWSKKTAVLNSNIKACWAVTNHHLCISQWDKSSATFTAVMLLPFMSRTWFNSILWFWCLALSAPYLLTPWSTSVIRLNNICSAGPLAPTCLNQHRHFWFMMVWSAFSRLFFFLFTSKIEITVQLTSPSVMSQDS